MQCTYTKLNKKRCKAQAMAGEEYCFFHKPGSGDSQKRQEAQSRGGQTKLVRIQNPLSPIDLKEVNDVVLLLEDTINRVRSGELDVKIGNCIGVLSGQLIKAIEVSSIANRVEIIERAILERRTTIS
ncbi:hypothetical protein HN748_01225 [Candidatus Peregrinibacteria bacterium]|jgi:hypothetical protein|nr:hypothetical protein [Candidatus Peregrinibacteria bacterium]MBT7483160.1 hypothetical protein [Candidatus Peregrinibacteria bacterium]MBT7702832.1 hypothetical protein [Candidatus Peregrinibacteria bacterium]